MEPVTQTILVKSISSAVSCAAQSLCKKIQNSIFEKKEIESIIFDSSYFDPLIEEYIESINGEISKLDENLGINFESICKFFEYPPIECIIRQIYAANLPNNFTHAENIKEIKKEFTLLLSQYFDVKEEEILGISTLLFSILIEGCQETLNKQISNGEITALVAISSYHSKVILDELSGIRKNIEFLLKEEVNFEDIQHFFGKYCNVLRSRHEWITISNFEGGVRKPIEEIYVCPNFIKRSKGNENSNSLEFFDFISKAHRVVLLGDPGSGKTTFTKKMCYELSSRYSDRLFAGRELVPFVVVVRDYHAEKKKYNSSIIDFINEELSNDFQIKPPKGTFEYLLLNGYILLIFDGLDELLDTRFREKMVNEIESFCTLYPSIPTIVTSRRIGYEEAALREDMFEIYEMTSFNRKQIQEYVEKWFGLDLDLRLSERSEKAKRFMIESERVSDLRSNSLMLSLMCNIYKQENYIPENRPKIYQKCAEMLFKKWDRHRGINPEITIQDSKIEFLISHLAHWIYTSEFSKEGVSEEELIRKTTEYLHGSVYEDFDEAKKVAKDFVNFSKGRAWIFTAIGARNYQDLYQFTHRTFLEYFTADWFCRNYEETNELTNSLIPKISKREWDVVAQLALQMRGEYSESATDKIFTTILNKAKESEEVEHENLLSFAARSLEFMTPNPIIVKEITKDCFEFSLYLGKNYIKKMEHPPDFQLDLTKRDPPIKLILDLKYSSVRENRNKVVETLKKLIVDHIKSEDECEAILAAEIIFELGSRKNSKPFDENGILYWSEISNVLLKECYQYKKYLFEEDIHLCIQSYEVLFNSKIEVILELQGLEGLLSHYSNIMNLGAYTYGIGENLLYKLFGLNFHPKSVGTNPYKMETWEKISEDLKKIGEFCLDHPLPTSVREKNLTGVEMYGISLLRSRFRNYIDNGAKFNNPNNYLDPTSIFGEFCLFAILFELNRDRQSRLKTYMELIEMMDLTPLTKIFLVWLEKADFIEIENEGSELNILKLTKIQKKFIANWAQKNILFLSINNKSLGNERNYAI